MMYHSRHNNHHTSGNRSTSSFGIWCVIFLATVCLYDQYTHRYTIVSSPMYMMTHALTINTTPTRISLSKQQQEQFFQIYQQSERNYDSNHHHEFDFVLQENEEQNHKTVQKQMSISNRRMVVLPNQQQQFGQPQSHVLLVSSSSASAFPGTSTTLDDSYYNNNDNEATTSSSTATTETTDSDDPYASSILDTTSKVQQYKQQQQTKGSFIENKIKSMDLQDMVLTLFIPGVLCYVTGRYIVQKISKQISTKTDMLLENFSNEMIYHDGDFIEMGLCIDDYMKKLMFSHNPLQIKNTMMKQYIQVYTKKKTISPQAIVSIAHVCNYMKYTTQQFSQLLIQLCCSELGADKISSIGKIYFIGTRILQNKHIDRQPSSDTSLTSDDLLLPIKKFIMSTYRDIRVAESFVETSQQAIAEAAYRTAVLNAGKNQPSLVPGWDILGLSHETAMTIWESEKKENFVSDIESMYGGQTRKYDKDGRQITSEGKLVNPEEATASDNDTSNTSTTTSNVYECGNCGFTLFIATGRESKFFGDTFKCPECGAAKSEFNPRTTEE